MYRMRELIAATMVAGFCFGTAASASAYEGGEVKDGGTITGTIRFAGTPPARKELDLQLTDEEDKEVCGKEKHLSWDLVVGPQQGIENAVVRLIDVNKGKSWAITDATIDQKGCNYKPHVVVLPAGGRLHILNSDGILHNIHTRSKVNPTFNKAQPKFKKELITTLAKAELFKVTCDAHNFMLGWLVVSDQPYVAVTNDKGEFTLGDVPPGKYKLAVWQETLGEKVQDVTVEPKQETKLTIELAKQ
ncbi:MAG: carboxypeptidase regulatory-like domain-containing protein [candidate division NC10 bacterium]|nr:carboxypeptidase regulatory-like domain-containing protein [candidate division NC10 bacterium]MDE2321731.1 carboxypeptidase regulatory-like domain-containing protein [candidate division NC10 bacterium]